VLGQELHFEKKGRVDKKFTSVFEAWSGDYLFSVHVDRDLVFPDDLVIFPGDRNPVKTADMD
jgi:hypothetical protein